MFASLGALSSDRCPKTVLTNYSLPNHLHLACIILAHSKMDSSLLLPGSMPLPHAEQRPEPRFAWLPSRGTIPPTLSGHTPTPDITEDIGWVLGFVLVRLVLFRGGFLFCFWFGFLFCFMFLGVFCFVLFGFCFGFFLPDEGDVIWSYKDEKTNTNKLCWCQLNVAMSPGNSFLKLFSPHFSIRCTGTNIKSFNGIRKKHRQSIKWTD